jgi:hypothetical protein
MASDSERAYSRRTLWLAWLALVAGAVMCIAAVLMS